MVLLFFKVLAKYVLTLQWNIHPVVRITSTPCDLFQYVLESDSLPCSMNKYTILTHKSTSFQYRSNTDKEKHDDILGSKKRWMKESLRYYVCL